MRGEKVPQPLIHDLICSVIKTFGGSIDAIIVNDLKNDTFYAQLVLNIKGKQLLIDCKPSDASTLTLSGFEKAPIYTTESIMEKAGIMMEEKQ
jgi:bifunctional DNase/RNase